MKFFSIATVIALAGMSPVAAATITTLYNTGVDASGTAVTGNGADSHWTLNGGAAYTGGTNGTFPIGPWLAETSTSRWLTPSANAADSFNPSADGIYRYTETFSLTGLKAATATLSGRFASDNTIDAVLLNGTAITGSGGSFQSFTTFNSTGGTFNAGVNTLTFVLRNFAQNGGNPTGLRVEVTGTAAIVPEPAMWGLLVVGFGLVGVATRRRSAAVAA